MKPCNLTNRPPQYGGKARRLAGRVESGHTQSDGAGFQRPRRAVCKGRTVQTRPHGGSLRRQTLPQLLAVPAVDAEAENAKQVMASAKAVGGLHIITSTRQGLDANALRTMGDFLRDKDPVVVAVLASIVGEKVSFLAVCGKEAVAKGIKAGELVKSVSAVCGGKGGGKPDSAMGGGTDLLKVDDALATVDDFVSSKLG